jgi:hypothetical protein
VATPSLTPSDNVQKRTRPYSAPQAVLWSTRTRLSTAASAASVCGKGDQCVARVRAHLSLGALCSALAYGGHLHASIYYRIPSIRPAGGEGNKQMCLARMEYLQ